MKKKLVGVIVFTTEEITKKSFRGHVCRETWCYVISKTPTTHNINKLMEEKRKWFSKEYGCNDAVSSLKHLIVFDKNLDRDRDTEFFIKLFFDEDLISWNLNKNPIRFGESFKI